MLTGKKYLQIFSRQISKIGNSLTVQFPINCILNRYLIYPNLIIVFLQIYSYEYHKNQKKKNQKSAIRKEKLYFSFQSEYINIKLISIFWYI